MEKIIKTEDKAKKLAEEKNIAYVDLRGFEVGKELFSLIPQDIAQKIRAVPYLKLDDHLRIATDRPDKAEEIRERLRDLLAKEGIKPQLFLASSKGVEEILSQYNLKRRKGEEKTPSLKDKEAKEEMPAKEKEQGEDNKKKEVSQKKLKAEKESSKKGKAKLEKLQGEIKNAPTTKMLQKILAGAQVNRASDVHIIPQKDHGRIRFRIDGVLQDVANVPIEDYKKILQRVKFHAKIKMNITTRPQDGRFELEIEDEKVDIRVSTFPSINGETIVMRLLVEEKEFYELNELGFNDQVLSRVKTAMNKPYGMIMNTGPTGSGKTTTLYAILDKLNQPEVKIITLEDPIEYHLTGITQTQIDAEHDFPFKSGLKHALRQDPDIIMVGEVRDKVTAGTALHASLTGHLLLTTLHTNNAASTFIRLMDMGIKPYLLVGSINLAMAQRLVRKLCDNCKKAWKPEKEEVENMRRLAGDKNLKVDKIYKKKGCSKCNNTGFKGRTVIAEAIVPTKKIEQVILEEKPTRHKIEKIAKEKENLKTMPEDGIDKVKKGITSLAEVLRVTA